MGRLCIVTTDSLPFEDRVEAGRLLGLELGHLRDLSPLVLGIPRGGLVVAHALAEALRAAMDAVFSLKLRFPGRPELAVGAVSEGGRVSLDEEFVEKMGIREPIEDEKRIRLAEILRRAELVRTHRQRIPIAGRTVIVTDDGVSTGATIRAAFRAVSEEKPARLIGAIPVGDKGAVEKLSNEADEMICLRCPPSFLAVTQFYRRYPQVTDEEIVGLFQLRRITEP